MAAGFALLPALTANTAVIVNAGGSALTNTVGTLALAGNFATTGAFSTTLAASANVTLTLPGTSQTLATLAGTETFTNKTLTAPTMTAPALGTPASGVLTNCTGLPNGGLVNSSVTIGSTNVALGGTAATIAGLTLTAPALGTPASGVLTNCTGLPISSGVSGLATGVATFLATPTSANLKAAVTDETGSGALVFANAPTLVAPVLGAATGTTLVTSGPITAGNSNLLAGATVSLVSGGTNFNAGTVIALSGALTFVSWNSGLGFALIFIDANGNVLSLASSNASGGNSSFDTTNSFSSNSANGVAVVVSGGNVFVQTKTNYSGPTPCRLAQFG